MADDDGRTGDGKAGGDAGSEPRCNWLRRIIGQGPMARKRLSEAVAALLGTALIALAAIGGLVIWHLVRRGRIIRERLDPPKVVRMPELADRTGDLHDEDGGVPTP